MQTAKAAPGYDTHLQGRRSVNPNPCATRLGTMRVSWAVSGDGIQDNRPHGDKIASLTVELVTDQHRIDAEPPPEFALAEAMLRVRIVAMATGAKRDRPAVRRFCSDAAVLAEGARLHADVSRFIAGFHTAFQAWKAANQCEVNWIAAERVLEFGAANALHRLLEHDARRCRER